MTTTGEPLNHAVVSGADPVRHPRARGDHGEPGSAGEPRGRLGGEHGRLLVPHVNQPHRRVRLHRPVVQREHVPAGQGEHRAHAIPARGSHRVRTAVPCRFLRLLGHADGTSRSAGSGVAGVVACAVTAEPWSPPRPCAGRSCQRRPGRRSRRTSPVTWAPCARPGAAGSPACSGHRGSATGPTRPACRRSRRNAAGQQQQRHADVHADEPGVPGVGEPGLDGFLAPAISTP